MELWISTGLLKFWMLIEIFQMTLNASVYSCKESWRGAWNVCLSCLSVVILGNGGGLDVAKFMIPKGGAKKRNVGKTGADAKQCCHVCGFG